MLTKAGIKRKARSQRRGGDEVPVDDVMDAGDEAGELGSDEGDRDKDREESRRLIAGEALRQHRITNAFNRVRQSEVLKQRILNPPRRCFF